VNPEHYPGLERTFRENYQRLKGQAAPAFAVQFYPYRNLTNTIRARDGRILVRISDILEEAPEPVLSALVAILLYKLCRRRVPRSHLALYRSYVNEPATRARTDAMRRLRGRKQFGTPAGEIFNLKQMFDRLNADYFDHRVEVAHLSWSARVSRRVLGHFDPAHRAIVINRKLDHPLVPESVVQYVLYHEMLHVVLGIEHSAEGRRHCHHARFRQEERRFAHYARARQFIRESL